MEKILNLLANGVIDGPDDLMGIGECLNLLDDLEGQIGTQDRWLKTIERARLIFKRLILEESADRSADWLEIQKLLGSLGPLHFGQGAMEEAARDNRRDRSAIRRGRRLFCVHGHGFRQWFGSGESALDLETLFDEENGSEVDRDARP